MNIKEAYLKVLGLDQKPLEEKKMGRPTWVPESIVDEKVSDFMGAVAQAHKDGKDTFEFGGKKYKVTMGKDTAKDIHSKMDESKNISEKEVETCDDCGKVHEGSCSSKKEGYSKKEDVDRVARADYKVNASGNKSHKEITFKNADTKESYNELFNTLTTVLSEEEATSIVNKLMEKAAPAEKQEMGDNLSDGELEFVDKHEIEISDFVPEDPEHDEVHDRASEPKANPVNQKPVVDRPDANKPEVAVKSKAEAPKTK